jgi:hypothetical protein
MWRPFLLVSKREEREEINLNFKALHIQEPENKAFGHI